MQYRRIAYLSLPLLTLAIGAAAVAPVQAQTTLILPPGTIQRVQQTVIVAPSAPPAMETEVVPAPPGGQPMYWQPGHWNWTSGGWVWVGGNYVTPPQPTAAWVPGQWVTQPGGGFVWIDGHWQS